MEAIKTKAVAHKGVLTIPVPKEFEEKELDVIILSDGDNKEDDVEIEEKRKKQHEEKVRTLMSIVGTAKYPDFPITKYDVYDQ
jgi:hypothetical protein